MDRFFTGARVRVAMEYMQYPSGLDPKAGCNFPPIGTERDVEKLSAMYSYPGSTGTGRHYKVIWEGKHVSEGHVQID